MTDSSEPKKETVRIHLPTRAPTDPLLPSEPPSQIRPGTIIPASMTPQSSKTEGRPSVDLTKTETLTSMVTIAPPGQPVARIEEVPLSLCWGLLAGSAAILILQIWNYLS